MSLSGGTATPCPGITDCVNPGFGEYSEMQIPEPSGGGTVAGYQTVAQRNLTCATRIRERRRELRLTQAEVVDRVSVHGSQLSNQALSAIENGRRLAVGRLPDLAQALDCTVTYLLGLTTDPRRWQPDSQPGEKPGNQPGERPGVPPQPRRPAASGPVRASRRSWILGPDVPSTPRDMRDTRDARTHPS